MRARRAKPQFEELKGTRRCSGSIEPHPADRRHSGDCREIEAQHGVGRRTGLAVTVGPSAAAKRQMTPSAGCIRAQGALESNM
jgi:hypothetical protein